MTAPLAPDLGRIAAAPSAAPYEDVRLRLLDALVTARSEGRLGQAAWQEAFDGAAQSLKLRVIAEADQALRAAAEHSRYPTRRLANLLPDAEAADILLQRLLAEGMPLERLDALPADDDGRRLRAIAIEAAWDGAVALAAAESARWRALAERVAAWRRPMRPFWIGTVATLAVLALIAAWLGGQLPAPAWFAPVRDAFWRLPWP